MTNVGCDESHQFWKSYDVLMESRKRRTILEQQMVRNIAPYLKKILKNPSISAVNGKRK